MNKIDNNKVVDKSKEAIEKAKKVKSEELAKALLIKAFQLRKTILLAAICGTMSACGTIDAPAPTSDGRILISADAKGMQAFGDVFNGAITNGKATADKDTAHWELRRNQAKEETVQKYAPSFLGGIFGTQTGVIPVRQESSKSVQVVGANQGAIIEK